MSLPGPSAHPHSHHRPNSGSGSRRNLTGLLLIGVFTALALVVSLVYFTVRRHDASGLAPLPKASVKMNLAALQLGQDLVFPKITSVKVSSKCRLVFDTETRVRLEERLTNLARWNLIAGQVTVANTTTGLFQNEFLIGGWALRETGTQYTLHSEPLRLEVEVLSGSLSASNLSSGAVLNLPAGSRRLLPLAEGIL